MTASNITDRHARLHRLCDDRQLLLGGKASPPGHAGDDLNAGKRVGHRHSPTHTPRSCGQRRCPIETGSSSERERV
jgi:hypothetical protein